MSEEGRPRAPGGPNRLCGGKPAPNLVLCGFMGTGKTAVARRIARRRGLPLVDCDERIEAQARRSVRDIFQAFGERGFRAFERRIVAAVAATGPAVIATGGGVLLDERNRSALCRRGILILLTARPATLASRLQPTRGARPLLADGDLHMRIHGLLASRASMYGAVRRRVSTDGRTVGEVAALVWECYSRSLR